MHSSCKIDRASYHSVAFRYVAANTHLDHDTLATFRHRLLKEVQKLFVQVLGREMKLLELGHIALDCTKVDANASNHRALASGRTPASSRPSCGARCIPCWLWPRKATAHPRRMARTYPPRSRVVKIN